MNNLNYSFERSMSFFSTENLRSVKAPTTDRFIPLRNQVESDLTNYDTPKKDDKSKNPDKKQTDQINPKSIPIFISDSPESSNKKKYSRILKSKILGKNQGDKSSILSFSSVSKRSSCFNKMPDDFCKVISAFDWDFDISNCLLTRSFPLPSKPYKILDAPDMEDDFYKQLLHWSPTANKIAIGLSNSVYLWDVASQQASELCELPESEELCSLRWSPDGKKLAFGMDSGEIKLWDVKKNKSLQSLTGHNDTVGAIDWPDIMYSGSKDRSVQTIDPRIGNSTVKKFIGHSKQILNVKSAPLNQPFILSSGNDSKVLVFDVRKEKSSIFKINHEGPVRAIGWNPKKKGIFASGGGSTDKTLRLWNLTRKTKIDEVLVGSQICDLKFSPLENEIITSLGGKSNVVEFWTTKNLQKCGALKGHTSRVLNIDFSPDGTQLVSIAPDETMRFWEVNQAVRQRSKTHAVAPPKFKMAFGMR